MIQDAPLERRALAPLKGEDAVTVVEGGLDAEKWIDKR
jgi:hypothetical protein